MASTSNASDRGLLALNDLARAAAGTDYCVVGGHMVHLLSHAFPVAGITARATVDADAGVDRPTAAGGSLHRALESHGYRAVSGNQYVRTSEGHELSIDILIPRTTSSETVILGSRGFDPVPGLSLALALPAIELEVQVALRNQRRLEFTVPVPTIEAAVVLKVLAWASRKADKDLVDIAALMEIVAAHRDNLAWSLDRPELRDERLDAARAVQLLLATRRALPTRTRARLQMHVSRL